MEQIRVFEGGLNTDDSPETTPPTDYPYLLNGAKAKSADGHRGTIENMIGTTVLAGIAELDANSTCVGTIRDGKNNAWFLFFHNTDPLKHCIVRLGAATVGAVPVISKVIAWEGLLFDLNFLITGGCIVDNVIYFTDNKNGPRCINVNRYAGLAIPEDEEEIALIKRSGIYAPTWVKGTSGVDLNLTGKFGFQFAYQYEYEDNQFSVLSPYSTLCPQNTLNETYNKIRVFIRTTPPASIEDIPKLVVRVRVAARIGNNGNFYYVGEIVPTLWDENKAYIIDDVVTDEFGVWWQAKANITTFPAPAPVEGTDWTTLSIGLDFFNNTNGTIVPSIYQNPYHLVPRKAKCIELIKNRLWFGNYLEGYNTPPEAGLSVVTESVALPNTGSIITTNKMIIKIQKIQWNSYDADPSPFNQRWEWDTGTFIEYVHDATALPFNGGGTTTDFMIIDSYRTDDVSANKGQVKGQRVEWNSTSGGYYQKYGGLVSSPAPVPPDGVALNSSGRPAINATAQSQHVVGYKTVIFQQGEKFFLGGGTLQLRATYKITDYDYQWTTALGWTFLGSSFVQGTPVTVSSGVNTDVIIVDPVLTPVADSRGTTMHTITGQRVNFNVTFWQNETASPFNGKTGGSNPAAPPTTTGFKEGIHFHIYALSTFQTIANYNVPPVPLTGFEGRKTFPSGSSYRLGYVLKDMHGRDIGGVITSNALAINTPKNYFNIVNARWSFQGAPPVGAIPPEATSYSIVMSRNLTKSYFAEHRAVDIYYYKVQPDFSETISLVYGATNDGIRLDITPITKSGIGYEFQEGDRLIIYPTLVNTDWNLSPHDKVFDLPVISFDGIYIKVPNRDIGTIVLPGGGSPAGARTLFEIYRPVTVPSEILYYAIGQNYPIVDGQFSVTTGLIEGDSVNTIRNNFVHATSGDYYQIDSAPYDKQLFKAMSFDPQGAWDTDQGKPFVKTTIGETLKDNYFRFSATIINDTSTNGLCEHYFGDESNVPQENGPINKLKSAARQADEGNVLLAISRNETASIYVDEQDLSLDKGTSFLIQSTDVIGSVQTLKSNALGTVHPESVYDIGGNVFWWDAIHKKVVRYASNGLFPISDVRMIDHFEDTAVVNTTSRVVMGYDPFYRVFYITHSQGLSSRRTVSWSEEVKRWISFHSFEPEFYVDLDSILYTIKAGTFHAHTNTAQFNQFYGTVYNTVLELDFNDSPGSPKYWSVVQMLLSKNFWSWVAGEQKIPAGRLLFELENEFGQLTDVTGERLDYDENFAYSAIMKDKNTAGVTNPLLNGDDMWSHVAKGRLTIYGQPNDVLKRINLVKVGFEVSKGHQL